MQFGPLNNALDTYTQTAIKNKRNAVSPQTYLKVRILESSEIRPARETGFLRFGPAPNPSDFLIKPLFKFEVFEPRQARGQFGRFSDPPERALGTTQIRPTDSTETTTETTTKIKTNDDNDEEDVDEDDDNDQSSDQSIDGSIDRLIDRLID